MRSRLGSATGLCGVSRLYGMDGALTVFIYGIHWLELHFIQRAMMDGDEDRSGNTAYTKIIPTISHFTLFAHMTTMLLHAPLTCSLKSPTGTTTLSSLVEHSTHCCVPRARLSCLAPAATQDMTAVAEMHHARSFMRDRTAVARTQVSNRTHT